MCRDCGCQTANRRARPPGFSAAAASGLSFRALDSGHTHGLGHSHAPGHAHEHGHGHTLSAAANSPRRTLSVEEAVLARNDAIAASNRAWFQTHGIRALNLISAPGSGKTLLLEKTVQALRDRLPLSILTGDQEGDFDAERLRKSGARVLQLRTGASCHLDAAMIQRNLGTFVAPEPQLLIIENVGNLVCPAAFDLGEEAKVALLSTTEGEDKPSKYPLLFHEARLIVLTKMDLAPHLDWDEALCLRHLRGVNAHAPILRLSAKTGEGLDPWLSFLDVRPGGMPS